MSRFPRRIGAPSGIALRLAPGLLPGLVLAAAALLAPGRAAAYERQWHFGASFGYDALFGGSTAHGFGGGVHLAYGLNDMFNLIAEIDATAHPTGPWTVVSGAVGAAYVLDVLQWVPWVGAEVGPAALVALDSKCGLSTLEPCAAFRVNLAIPFGIDYQVSRSFNIGLSGRFQLLLLGSTPWETLGGFARAEYVWGY
jgi:hypothetical protein